jgi:hypothetical protein
LLGRRELIRMSGAMKSFQAARKANSPTVTMPGRTAGRRIWRKTPNVPGRRGDNASVPTGHRDGRPVLPHRLSDELGGRAES